MAKPTRRVKVSKNGKLFVSRVARTNRAQMQFKRLIGDPMGDCIQAKEKGKSYTLTEKKENIAACQVQLGITKGMTLPVIDSDSYYNRLREGRVGGGQPVSV